MQSRELKLPLLSMIQSRHDVGDTFALAELFQVAVAERADLGEEQIGVAGSQVSLESLDMDLDAVDCDNF